MRFAALVVLGFVLGFGGQYLLSRGSVARYIAERDAALASDSAATERAENAEHALGRLIAEADSLDQLRERAEEEVDSLLARPPRSIIVYRPAPDSGGPAVPVEVVLRSDYDTLAARCDRLRGTCAATTTALRVALDSAEGVAALWRARGDSLAARVRDFTVPRSAGRWSLGCSGPLGVTAEGFAWAAACGPTFNIFR